MRGNLGTLAGSLKDVAAGLPVTAVGHLEKDQEKTCAYISLHMRESAGNEYQNLTLEAFDIQLIAPQDTVEEDAFNNQYDAGAGIEVTPEANLTELINGLKDGDVLNLGAGVYNWDNNSALMIFADNVTIKGAGPQTVIKMGNAAFVHGDNVTISDLTIDSDAADGNIPALKVTYSNTPETIKNVTIRNVVLRSEKSHGLNLHDVDGAVIDNVSVEAYGKCAFSVTDATNVTFKNCKSAQDGWGFDIGMMVGDANKPGSMTFDKSNAFGNGAIYSEAPNNTVTFPDNWEKTENTNGWLLVRTVKGLMDEMAAAQPGDTIVVKEDLRVISAMKIPAGVKLVGTKDAVITVNSTGDIINLLEGASVEGVKFAITDDESANVLYMNTGASVKNCEFTGTYENGENEVSRGIVVAPGAKNVVIEGNIFTAMRQPAYINNSVTGIVKNNTVTATRGFVVVSNAEVEFTGNKFADNAVDIAIIAENGIDTDFYQGKAAAMSTANGGAYVENQKSLEYAQDGAACVKK